MRIDDVRTVPDALEFHEEQKKLRREFERRRLERMYKHLQPIAPKLQDRNEEIQARYLKKKADQRERKFNRKNQ